MFRIVIDAGHGEKDNKGVYPEYREGAQMWKLSQKIIAKLADYSCEVITTRPKITDNPLPEERGKMAKGADLFLSLHSNTPSSKDKGKPSYEKATGTISFYSVKRPNDKPFAERLAKLVADKMGIYSRGAQAKAKNNGDDWYAVIRNSIAVGCKHSFIIEHGFHSNRHDCAWLLDDKNLEKLAEAESELITTYYDIPKKYVPPKDKIEKGDLVHIIDDAVYWNDKKIPKSVLARNYWVVSVNHDIGRAVLGKSEDGSFNLNSAVAEKYLRKVEPTTAAATFPALKDYNGTSLETALNLIGISATFSNRYKIAKANGESLYLGTKSQNARLLALLKEGELLKP